MFDPSLNASTSILGEIHASVQLPMQPVSTFPESSGSASYEQPAGACVSEQPVSTSSESPGCAASEQAVGAYISEQHVLNHSPLHVEPNGQSHSILDDGESIDILHRQLVSKWPVSLDSFII
ncbi:hypothetical protein V6N11_035176 [Hibiscus sabdariffa]|uniref:Uncharacterized protein n=1 Tax=Hibiscus sabdariffa TaxID=183260 RepID=A0ABR2QZK9_9ROSI